MVGVPALGRPSLRCVGSVVVVVYSASSGVVVAAMAMFTTAAPRRCSYGIPFYDG